MIPRVSLRKALADPELLGSVLAGSSWRAWRVLLIGAMGERLTTSERALFEQLTGREREPGARVEEFDGVIGRRGGKSRAISVLATYIAGLCEHPALVPGERGVCLIIAPDQKQADIVLDYIEAAFSGSPILGQLIEQRTQRELRLTNGIDIEVRAADFRRLRGPTYVIVIADEVSFWMADGSANPDTEILNAVRPGLATTHGPLFLISSPYARRGELWRTYKKHFGAGGDPLILVAQGSSRTFNPTLPQFIVDRAMERDPVSAAAEYGAQFRTDIEGFVSIEAVAACVTEGLRERPPERNKNYVGFVDPSGGSADSFTACVAHNEVAKQTIVIDAVREIAPPFSPEQATKELAELLKRYRIYSATGDRFGGEWPREQFAKFGIQYKLSPKPKSDLYLDTLPLLNSCRIELLDHPKLVSQFVGLERRTARGGRSSIDHGPRGHDDLANAVAGAAVIASSRYGGFDTSGRWIDGPDIENEEEANREWRRMRMVSYVLSGGHFILP